MESVSVDWRMCITSRIFGFLISGKLWQLRLLDFFSPAAPCFRCQRSSLLLVTCLYQQEFSRWCSLPPLYSSDTKIWCMCEITHAWKANLRVSSGHVWRLSCQFSPPVPLIRAFSSALPLQIHLLLLLLFSHLGIIHLYIYVFCAICQVVSFWENLFRAFSLLYMAFLPPSRYS